jgi:hypothetical protein
MSEGELKKRIDKLSKDIETTTFMKEHNLGLTDEWGTTILSDAAYDNEALEFTQEVLKLVGVILEGSKEDWINTVTELSPETVKWFQKWFGDLP